MGRRRRRARPSVRSSSCPTRSCPVSAPPPRRAYGAGAVALVLGPADGAPAVLRERATRSMPVLDRYRADGASANGDPYDPRLFREVVYLPVMSDGRQSGRRRSGARARTARTPPRWRPGRSPTLTASSHPCSPSGSALLRLCRFRCRPSSATPARRRRCSVSSLRWQKQARSGPTGYGGGRATAVAVRGRPSGPGSRRREPQARVGPPDRVHR